MKRLNYDEAQAAIAEAVKQFPAYFTLPVFAKTRCRLGHPSSHFFSEKEGLQLVVQAEQPDGGWMPGEIRRNSC